LNDRIALDRLNYDAVPGALLGSIGEHHGLPVLQVVGPAGLVLFQEVVMNAFQRAAQIWAVLALAARNRQVLTYEIVGRLIGMPRQGLGRMLEPIQSYCLVNHLEPLTILVVSEQTGLPGDGFVAAADIPATQQRVFAFDWMEYGCPSPQDLQNAVEQQPSNGIHAIAAQ
jgi:hypothetical protein